MIVPMLKYTFVAYHLEYDKFLKDIRDIGILDIVEKTINQGSLSKEKLDYFKNAKQVYDFLEKQKISALAEIKETEEDLKRRNVDIEHKNFALKKWPEIYVEDIEPFNKKLTIIRFQYYRDKFGNKAYKKPALNGEEILDKVLKYRDQKYALIQHDLILNKALKAAQPWGEFSTETIQKLKENNVDIRLFTTSKNSTTSG